MQALHTQPFPARSRPLMSQAARPSTTVAPMSVTASPAWPVDWLVEMAVEARAEAAAKGRPA